MCPAGSSPRAIHAAEIPTNVPTSSTDRPPVAWTSTSSRAPSSGWVIISARSSPGQLAVAGGDLVGDGHRPSR